MKWRIYAAYALFAGVVLANLFLSSRSIFRTHFLSTDPSVTAPGAFSDLFPRWHGSREMFFNGKNPYGDEITLENQHAFYGPFDPEDGVARDPMGFAYPATIAIPLLPLLPLSYRMALAIMTLFCIGTLAWGLFAWIGWTVPGLGREWKFSMAAVALALQPAISTVLLRQPAIFAFLGLTATLYCLRNGKNAAAGVWLALACTKPQMAIFVVIGVHIWAVSDWTSYRRLIISFWIANVVAAGIICVFVPLWPLEWLRAVARYKDEAFGAVSAIDYYLGPGTPALLIKVAIAAATVFAWRRAPVDMESEPVNPYALAMVTPLLVFSAAHVYNHVFVYPLVFLFVPLLFHREGLAKAAGGAFVAMTLILYAWSTSPLVLKNFPPATRLLGLDPAIFANANMWQFPWSLFLPVPILLFAGYFAMGFWKTGAMSRV